MQMEKFLASQEGRRRGWYSYTELNILLCDKNFAFIKDFLSVRHYVILISTPPTYNLTIVRIFQCYIMCCISYTASILSMIGFGLLTLQIKDIIVNNVSLDLFNAESVLSTSCTSSVANTFNATSAPIHTTFDNSTDISDELLPEEIDLCGVKSFGAEKGCDNSSSSCCFSNISTERFLLTIKLPSTYAEILQMLERSKKSSVIKKKSLVFTKYA